MKFNRDLPPFLALTPRYCFTVRPGKFDSPAVKVKLLKANLLFVRKHPNGGQFNVSLKNLTPAKERSNPPMKQYLRLLIVSKTQWHLILLRDDTKIDIRVASLKWDQIFTDSNYQLSESERPTPKRRWKLYETKLFWPTVPVTSVSPSTKTTSRKTSRDPVA